LAIYTTSDRPNAVIIGYTRVTSVFFYQSHGFVNTYDI